LSLAIELFVAGSFLKKDLILNNFLGLEYCLEDITGKSLHFKLSFHNGAKCRIFSERWSCWQGIKKKISPTSFFTSIFVMLRDEGVEKAQADIQATSTHNLLVHTLL